MAGGGATVSSVEAAAAGGDAGTTWGAEAHPTTLRSLQRRLGVAQETTRMKQEQLQQAEEEYDDEHSTFVRFQARTEEKWAQRYDALAALAERAGVAADEIAAIRSRPWQEAAAATASDTAPSPASPPPAAPPPDAPASIRRDAQPPRVVAQRDERGERRERREQRRAAEQREAAIEPTTAGGRKRKVYGGVNVNEADANGGDEAEFGGAGGWGAGGLGDRTGVG